MNADKTIRVKICCIMSIEEAGLTIECGADALLIDSGNQSVPVKELGGTGRVHDWKISAQL